MTRRKYTLNENYFEKIDTEEKAYWLGFLMADGCIIESNNCIQIRLAAIDISHLEKFKKSLNSTHKIFNEQIHTKFPNKRSVICESSYIRIYSKKMMQDVITHGIVANKTGKEIFKTFNNDILDTAYIRGLIDGDGTFTLYNFKNKNNPNLQTNIVLRLYGNKELVTDCNEYIYNKFKFTTPVNISTNRNMYVMQFSSAKAIHVLDYLYKDATIYLERKYQKYQEILKNEQIKRLLTFSL